MKAAALLVLLAASLPGHARITGPTGALTARVLTAFPPVSVTVADDQGNPLAGVDVTFTHDGPTGEQALLNGGSAIHATSDSNGVATIARVLYCAKPATHTYHVTSSAGNVDVQLVVLDGARPARVEVAGGMGQSVTGAGYSPSRSRHGSTTPAAARCPTPS
jgi:hypothetical protein